jgi:hypothetical protein
LNILICFFVFDIKNDFWVGLITIENNPMAFHGKQLLLGEVMETTLLNANCLLISNDVKVIT